MSDHADVVDAGPVPGHLLLEVEGDDVDLDGVDESGSAAGAAGSEIVDAGPPPADLLVLADGFDDDGEPEPSTGSPDSD